MSRCTVFGYVCRHGGAAGQVALFAPALLVVLLGGFAALSVDIGSYMRGRQQVENAVDAAALAGAQLLPSSGHDKITTEDLNCQNTQKKDNPASLACQYAKNNGHDPNDLSMPAGKRPELHITFRCIVGDDHGHPDADGIEAECPEVPTSPPADTFSCADGLCFICCKFNAADKPDNCNISNKCNTVVVDGSKFVPFYLAPVLQVAVGQSRTLEGFSTGTIRGSACRGLCGAPPTVLLDMVMIIDRTSSMDPTDLIKAKTAAKSVLEILNPNRQRVALGVLPAMGAGECAGTDAGWVPVRLSNDYQNPDGTLNTNSLLVRTIDNCLNSPESVTNLSAPMLAAKEHLLEDRTVDVKKGIILLTDGKPNDPGYGGPGGPFPCRLAFEASDLAQQAGIEIFTIGFGVAGQRCNESGSRYHNTLVTQLLADMASPVSNDNGCTDAENADGDHFLCQPKTENLTPIFKQAAAALASGSKLVHVPMGQ